MPPPPRTGLVAAGGGAKGAYEAGALSTLLPWMIDTGRTPSVLIGTSAGAWNIVALGGLAHLDPREATHRLVDTWATVRPGDVFGLTSGVDTGLRYLGQLAGLPLTIESLLDTRRLRTTLADRLPLRQLHENIEVGVVDAVAVATTSVATGATVVFVEKTHSIALPPDDAIRNITYVPTRLTIDHVLASAAVPLLFRPVWIGLPHRWRGWYLDGGLRLNAPLTPAVAFGCRSLGVVATQPLSPETPRHPTDHIPEPGEPSPDGPVPDLYAVTALTLRSLLADRMIEDLRRLSVTTATDEATEIVFAGPPDAHRNAIAELAQDVFRRYYRGVRAGRSPTLWLLTRLIGGRPEDHGNLLSYLFYDSEFTTRAAHLGRVHAHRVINDQRNHGPGHSCG